MAFQRCPPRGSLVHLLRPTNKAIQAFKPAVSKMETVNLKTSADSSWPGSRLATALLKATTRLALIFVCCVSLGLPAWSQGGDLRSGSLNPFPKNDIYRLHLVGDWLIDGFEPALRASLRSVPRIQLQDNQIKLQSLRRSNWDVPVAAIRDRTKSNDIDIAVVMFGVGEIGSLWRPGRGRLKFGSEDWLKQYATRIDTVMKTLKANKGMVYWLGLPIVARRDRSESYQLINTLVRERAYANGVTFIDVFSRFQDENGGFNRYGPDLDGTIKLMRAKDGVYFTGIGYAKIAHLLMQTIRRDLKLVKSQRLVTLAGSEVEQKSIRRAKQAVAARLKPNTATAVKKNATSSGGRSSIVANRFGAQKADDGSFVFKTRVNNKPIKITLKLPRPALSAAVMSLVTRNKSKDKPAHFGDNAVQVADGGVPLLSTVTPADRSALALRKRRLSPTQSVFFKVWGKGERLDPKPGRADDYQWPRPEPKPVVHVRSEPKTGEQSRRLVRQRRDPNLPPLPQQHPFR